MCRCHLSRRNLLAGGTALLAVSRICGAVADDAPAAGAPAPNAISGEEALARLMAGNARYSANTPAEKDFSAGRAARTLKQYPIAAVLSCADSRVAPELAFDQGPGDVFVVRLAGNFLDDDGLASLEYAVRFLGVPLVMVLGHSNCGAVDATIKVIKDGAQLPGHLPELIQSIRPAVEKAIQSGAPDLLSASIEANVRQNVGEIEDAEPILATMVSARKLKVVGGVYDLATGRIGLL